MPVLLEQGFIMTYKHLVWAYTHTHIYIVYILKHKLTIYNFNLNYLKFPKNFFLIFLVSWGSYFDFAINWNKHLDDENVKFILYEDLKKVRFWLLTIYSKIYYKISHREPTFNVWLCEQILHSIKKISIPDLWYNARKKKKHSA